MRQPVSSHDPRHAEGASARRARQSLWFALLLLGCGVDDRALYASVDSGGASANGGSAAAGHFAASGSGGDAGEASLPLCSYSGGAPAAGCATLVDNPGFGSNVAGWVAENVGVTEGWLDADATQTSGSGSLVVTNSNFKDDETAKGGYAVGGARQCVPAVTGRMYDLTGDIFVPAGQGKGSDGAYVSLATLGIFFYGAADCSGPTLGSFTSSSPQIDAEWVHIEGSTEAAKDTQSMAVRLATLKPFRQYSFEAHFDNVFVRER